MERFKALPRGTQLMLAAGVLLLVVSFFSWQKVSAEVAGVEVVSVTQSAWNGFWGVLLGLLTVGLLAWLVARLLGVEPRLPVSDVFLGAVLGAAIFASALLKALTDEFSTVWAWVGVALAALVAAGAWLRVQERGGVDALRAEAAALRDSEPGRDSGAPPETPPSREPPA